VLLFGLLLLFLRMLLLFLDMLLGHLLMITGLLGLLLLNWLLGLMVLEWRRSSHLLVVSGGETGGAVRRRRMVAAGLLLVAVELLLELMHGRQSRRRDEMDAGSVRWELLRLLLLMLILLLLVLKVRLGRGVVDHDGGRVHVRRFHIDRRFAHERNSLWLLGSVRRSGVTLRRVLMWDRVLLLNWSLLLLWLLLLRRLNLFLLLDFGLLDRFGLDGGGRRLLLLLRLFLVLGRLAVSLDLFSLSIGERLFGAIGGGLLGRGLLLLFFGFERFLEVSAGRDFVQDEALHVFVGHLDLGGNAFGAAFGQVGQMLAGGGDRLFIGFASLFGDQRLGRGADEGVQGLHHLEGLLGDLDGALGPIEEILLGAVVRQESQGSLELNATANFLASALFFFCCSSNLDFFRVFSSSN